MPGRCGGQLAGVQVAKGRGYWTAEYGIGIPLRWGSQNCETMMQKTKPLFHQAFWVVDTHIHTPRNTYTELSCTRSFKKVELRLLHRSQVKVTTHVTADFFLLIYCGKLPSSLPSAHCWSSQLLPTVMMRTTSLTDSPSILKTGR